MHILHTNICPFFDIKFQVTLISDNNVEIVDIIRGENISRKHTMDAAFGRRYGKSDLERVGNAYCVYKYRYLI